MGTWSVGSFGNDTACDWSYELEEAHDLSYVDSTLQSVVAFGSGTTVPSDEAESAIAAAEVVARLRGHWGEEDSYSDTADKWVRSHSAAPPPALVAKAVAALERVVTAPSDLLEMWDEVGESEDWIESVAELKQRLQS